MTPAMMAYRLTYRPLGSGLRLDRTLQAPGLDQAYAAAADLIAETHGMAGEHVAFDRTGARVTIGAGYRSRRGTFSLEPVVSGD
jgi:hypothetical protein